MNKHTKITLEEIMKRKEQILESKKKRKTAEIFVQSLNGTVTIQQPERELVADVNDMEPEDGNKLMVYETVIDPPLKSKQMQEAFVDAENGEQPFDIVYKIFDDGEVPLLAVEAVKLAGYIDSVKVVDAVKN